jgi:chromosome segregation ATPase
MDNQNYISELHKQNGEWKSLLTFVREEIETFKNRLSEVVSKNDDVEILAPAEHFQNQFIRHNEVIDELLHDINADEHRLVVNVKENNIAVEHRKVDVNENIISRMETFEKIYNDLKKEYIEYLTKVM